MSANAAHLTREPRQGARLKKNADGNENLGYSMYIKEGAY